MNEFEISEFPDDDLIDADQDGVDDTVFIDSDGDDVPDAIFTDLNEDGVLDAGIVDTDGDGVADVFVADRDQDGTLEEIVVDADRDGFLDVGGRAPDPSAVSGPTSTGAAPAIDLLGRAEIPATATNEAVATPPATSGPDTAPLPAGTQLAAETTPQVRAPIDLSLPTPTGTPTPEPEPDPVPNPAPRTGETGPGDRRLPDLADLRRNPGARDEESPAVDETQPGAEADG